MGRLIDRCLSCAFATRATCATCVGDCLYAVNGTVREGPSRPAPIVLDQDTQLGTRALQGAFAKPSMTTILLRGGRVDDTVGI